MTAIGNLNQRIVIQKLTRGADDGQGGYLPGTWTQVDEVWAQIEQGSGREVMMSDRTTHKADYKITVRRRNDITEAMKVIWVVDGVSRELAIVGVPLSLKQDKWTVLLCEEGQPS